eukprot:8417539-Lingulodinium_polyedra.AAC.1
MDALDETSGESVEVVCFLEKELMRLVQVVQMPVFGIRFNAQVAVGRRRQEAAAVFLQAQAVVESPGVGGLA